MKKIKDFFSKHGLVVFITLFSIMGMRGCIKNSRISKLEKERTQLIAQKDSLISLVPNEKNILLNDLKSKYNVYDEINNKMSKLDRQKQMMMFQNEQIIPQKEDLGNKIKALEAK
jgi:hypothetical protein